MKWLCLAVAAVTMVLAIKASAPLSLRICAPLLAAALAQALLWEMARVRRTRSAAPAPPPLPRPYALPTRVAVALAAAARARK